MEKRAKTLQGSKEIETPYLPSIENGHASRRDSPSVPSEGLSLAAATALRAVNVRKAVNLLAEEFVKHDLQTTFATIFEPRWCSLVREPQSDSDLASRAAWNLVCVWLLGQSSHAIKASCTVAEAEEWFLGAVRLPCRPLSEYINPENGWRAQQFLAAINLDADFWDLMPYVMEEHGPGSRASVMRDPNTAVARGEKRSKGVFYTPADVAEFMVGHAFENYEGDKRRAKCLDPACGTGVFLLAILRAVEADSRPTHHFDRFSYVCRFLFGCDISAQALDACAFVLLRECLSDVRANQISPWAAWHSIRLNLIQVDALTIEPPLPSSNEKPSDEGHLLTGIRSQLCSVPSCFCPAELGRIKRSAEARNIEVGLFAEEPTRIGDIFPDAPSGFELLVGNPPYAPLGERIDYSALVASYQSLSKAEASYNNFILFIEMMWRLTVAGCNATALVTPLSIAFHRGNHYQACRRAMTSNGGLWQFSFFDRQPHALFGEEVKTRNAILFRVENSRTPARGNRAEIYTGPLRKWTSRTRKYLFDNINFISLGQASIARNIPKLQNETQARVFTTLQSRVERLPSLTSKISSCAPYEAFGQSRLPRVFVGGTAYNFLNVYRETSLNENEKDLPLSESQIHCLEFQSERDAHVGFAVLVSRLSFWLWHILGDAFHVGGWLFNEIPLSKESFEATDYSALALLGRRFWERLQEHRFVSLNGGKLTVGFRPLACNEELDGIDELLTRTLGLPNNFGDELRMFVLNNAVVDTKDHKRNHVQKYFLASQST